MGKRERAVSFGRKYFWVFALIGAGVEFLIGFILVGGQLVSDQVLSLICLGLAIGMMAMLVKKVFGARAAAFCLPILLIAPLLVEYGFMGGLCSLMTLLVVLAVYAVLLAHEKKWRWLWAIGGLLALGSIFLLFKVGSDPLMVRQHFGAEQLLGVFSFGLLYKSPWSLVGTDWFYLAIVALILIFASILAWRHRSENRFFARRLFIGMATAPVLVLAVVANPFFGARVYLQGWLAWFTIFDYAGLAILLHLLIKNGHEKLRRIGYMAYVWFVILLMLGMSSLAEGTGVLNDTGNMSIPDVSELAEVIKPDACRENTVVVVGEYADYTQLAEYIPSYCSMQYGGLGDSAAGRIVTVARILRLLATFYQ